MYKLQIYIFIVRKKKYELAVLEFGPWAVNEEDSTNICTGAGIDKGGNISIIAILLSSWFIVLTLARVY